MMFLSTNLFIIAGQSRLFFSPRYAVITICGCKNTNRLSRSILLNCFFCFNGLIVLSRIRTSNRLDGFNESVDRSIIHLQQLVKVQRQILNAELHLANTDKKKKQNKIIILKSTAQYSKFPIKLCAVKCILS